MKTLVVYNKQGQLIFTQTNATDSYNLIVEDVAENKEIVGVNLSTEKCILVDKDATTEEKETIKRELLKTQEELSNKENELLKTQADYAELMYSNLLNK